MAIFGNCQRRFVVLSPVEEKGGGRDSLYFNWVFSYVKRNVPSLPSIIATSSKFVKVCQLCLLKALKLPQESTKNRKFFDLQNWKSQRVVNWI